MGEYNTQREKLIIREYGRNTQNIINHAKTIEDKQKRQDYIESVIEMIIAMHPHLKTIENYKMKIWSHVLQMADYELDVDVPENVPSAKDKRKADKVPYPRKIKNLRHYGKNIMTMIAKAKVMEDEEKKNDYIQIICSFMKLSYKEWNRENVQDEVIINEFRQIAGEDIPFPDEVDFDSLITATPKRRLNNTSKPTSRNRKSNKKKNNKNYRRNKR